MLSFTTQWAVGKQGGGSRMGDAKQGRKETADCREAHVLKRRLHGKVETLKSKYKGNTTVFMPIILKTVIGNNLFSSFYAEKAHLSL